MTPLSIGIPEEEVFGYPESIDFIIGWYREAIISRVLRSENGYQICFDCGDAEELFENQLTWLAVSWLMF